MANIIVTSTTNSISVDFGVYAGIESSTGVIPKKKCFRKEEISFSLLPSNERVEAITNYNNLTFSISFDGSIGTLQIDLINGVAPTSNSDLYDKLITLIA